MSNTFGNSINDLWSLIRHDNTCEIYLRSAAQKHLFAEKRAEQLHSDITEFKASTSIRETIGTLHIEMNFEHGVSSLRSSIEHLAQLINGVANLGLAQTRRQGSNIIDIYKVRDILLKSPDGNLRKLGGLLMSMTGSSWYTDLHDLRIELYHHQFQRFPRAHAVDMSRSSQNVEFLLPSGTAPSISDSKERQIDVYLDRQVENVRAVLEESFKLLIEYLKAKP
jgi:hypothetical protein